MLQANSLSAEKSTRDSEQPIIRSEALSSDLEALAVLAALRLLTSNFTINNVEWKAT